MAFDLLNIVNKFLATGTIISQVFIVLFILYFIFSSKKTVINSFFSKNGLTLAFVISLMATLGSLFYSNYAGFVPCTLCWFQRIFMYPQVIILGLAWFKKDNKILDYSLALSAVGLLVSVYHNYVLFNAKPSNFCILSEPCTVNYVLEYGYVTIPLMALTAFLLIIIFLGFKKYADKKIR